MALALGRGPVWAFVEVSILTGPFLDGEGALVGRVKSHFTLAHFDFFFSYGGLSFEKLANSSSPRPFLCSSRLRTLRTTSFTAAWKSARGPDGVHVVRRATRGRGPRTTGARGAGAQRAARGGRGTGRGGVHGGGGGRGGRRLVGRNAESRTRMIVAPACALRGMTSSSSPVDSDCGRLCHCRRPLSRVESSRVLPPPFVTRPVPRRRDSPRERLRPTGPR